MGHVAKSGDNMNVLVSVIVPVYKVEEYLDKCVSSIVEQTYNNLEIILVDDGSPDRCPEMCEAWAKIDTRVKVIHQSNEGLSSARNKALDVCNGEYIMFVDSDDWIEANAVEELLSLMIKNNLGVAFMNANIIKEGKVVGTDFHFYNDGSIVPSREIYHRIIRDEIGSQVWLKLYKATFWKQLRFPLGRLYEDLAVSFYPFYYNDFSVGFIDKPLYNYRINSNGISLGFNCKKAYHIYLGFLDHYNFASKYSPEDAEICLEKVVVSGMSVIHQEWHSNDDELLSFSKDVKSFLKANKIKILKCRFSKKRKAMIRIYYFSYPLYRFLGRIYKRNRMIK